MDDQDGQDGQDPLEYFQARFLFQPLSEADQKTIESAKNAIDTIDQGNLTYETYKKYQTHLKDIIDMSPNQVATASYLQERIGKKSLAEIYLIFLNGCVVVKTGGRGRPTQSNDGSEDSTESAKSKKSKTTERSAAFTRAVKRGGICQVTGAKLATRLLVASHILPLAVSNQNQKAKQYLELIRALFGSDALQRLLENVVDGDKGNATNINWPDNGIAMQSQVHDMWDGMYFYLEILWESYNSSTNEFDAKFHWLTPPQPGLYNQWNTTLGGFGPVYPLAEGDIIPFRRRNSPSSSSATTPSSLSTPSLTPAPSSTSASKTASKPATKLATKPAFPSPHLLYVREILTRVAHAMGAAGYLEYDLNDDDDDISVLASDLGEEETGRLSDPKQAEERMSQEDISQVAAWAEMSSSYIEEQRKLATQNVPCIDEHPNTTTPSKNGVGKQSKLPILGKRRRSWTEGMKLAPEEIQPGFRSSQSTGSETGSDSDSDSDPSPAMNRCLTIAI